MCLGSGLAKTETGFSDKGFWTLFKCFYEDKGRYGEFYFNYNTETGDAEICSKDENYATALLFGLAEEFKGRIDNLPMSKEKNGDIYEEADKVELIDWNKFSGVLVKLSENKDKTISRHATGLLKSLKL